MPGPGEDRPDPSEGLNRIEDLPRPKVRVPSRNPRRRPCPRRGHRAYRDGPGRRSLQDSGLPLTARPCHLISIHSQHDRSRGRKDFNADWTDLTDPGSHSTRRVVDAAVRLVIKDGLPSRAAGWTPWREHRVFVPDATIRNRVEAGGEKGGAAIRRRLSRLRTLGLLGFHRRRRAP